MERRGRVFDLELAYIHAAVIISISLTAYFLLAFQNVNSLGFYLAVVIFFSIIVIIFTNRNRYLGYSVSSEIIEPKWRAFIFTIPLSIQRDEVKGIYALDNRKWRWLRARDDKKTLMIVMKNGRTIRIDQPPGKLKSMIVKEWGIEIETRSSVELTMMRLEMNG